MTIKRNLLISIAAVVISAGMVFGQTTQPADKPVLVNAPADSSSQTPSAQPGQPAQPGQQQTPPAGQKPPTQNPGPCGLTGGGDMTLIFVMIGVLVLVMLFSSRSKKKEEQKRKDMIASIKKGDRIVTTAGIIGTALEVREDEVIIKIDENARMRILRQCVYQVGEDAKKEAAKQMDEKK